VSRYAGPMGKGYSRILKEIKREEAEERNAKTPDSRRKAGFVRSTGNSSASGRPTHGMMRR
jgi:hypothetical protein